MGLISWLLRLLGRGPYQRDVSRLPVDDGDAILETVDTSGGPLKEHHLRRALRDPRLLPKRRPALRPGALFTSQRPKIFSREEADRLFSGTLRTTNRTIRDLLTDEAQLERYSLPLWRSEDELAAALELTVPQLRHYSIHRERERVAHYVTFAIPKRGGGERLIMAPKRRLKAIQRRLHEQLVSRLPVSDHAHGFRPGRSVRTCAEPHVGRAVLLHLDLEDFFGTVHFGRVRGLLIAFGYSYPVATTLAVLMTEAPRQPVVLDDETFFVPVGPRTCVQGAPTSPGICNAIAARLDRRLDGLAAHLGWTYTRYADDLIFSGDDPTVLGRLLGSARQIVGGEGFRVNEAKTRIARRGSRQQVCGVTVNDTLGLSRRERRRLRATIHRLACRERDGLDLDPDELASLQGTLAYLQMLNPQQAEALRRSSEY